MVFSLCATGDTADVDVCFPGSPRLPFRRAESAPGVTTAYLARLESTVPPRVGAYQTLSTSFKGAWIDGGRWVKSSAFFLLVVKGRVQAPSRCLFSFKQFCIGPLVLVG